MSEFVDDLIKICGNIPDDCIRNEYFEKVVMSEIVKENKRNRDIFEEDEEWME